MQKSISVLLMISVFLSSSAFAQIDWHADARIPVRENMRECLVLLSPSEHHAGETDPLAEPSVNDSVGIPISKNNIADFKKSVSEILSTRGREAILGGHFFILGVPMQKRAQVERQYRAALSELNFSSTQVRVRVLTVPMAKIRWLSHQAFRALFERLIAFFPSIRNDYQSPVKEEVVSGLVSATAIEIPNIVYLYKSHPPADAAITIATHATLLTVFSIYKKFMVNWLLRPGSGHIEQFLKQLSISFPFIANYNIFGNFSKILSYYQTHGWDATAHQFPTELAGFATTQGFTLLLQTIFYNVVITQGIRGWENAQLGEINSRVARTVSNIVAVPVLALDAVFLSMAAASHSTLMHLGPFMFNTGHAMLGLLTFTGAALWAWPGILNPTIGWYQAAGNALTLFNHWMAQTTGINPRTYFGKKPK